MPASDISSTGQMFDSKRVTSTAAGAPDAAAPTDPPAVASTTARGTTAALQRGSEGVLMRLNRCKRCRSTDGRRAGAEEGLAGEAATADGRRTAPAARSRDMVDSDRDRSHDEHRRRPLLQLATVRSGHARGCQDDGSRRMRHPSRTSRPLSTTTGETGQDHLCSCRCSRSSGATSCPPACCPCPRRPPSLAGRVSRRPSGGPRGSGCSQRRSSSTRLRRWKGNGRRGGGGGGEGRPPEGSPPPPPHPLYPRARGSTTAPTAPSLIVSPVGRRWLRRC